MGIGIIEGRDFKETDGDVCIINEAFKRKCPDIIELGKPLDGGELPILGGVQELSRQHRPYRLQHGAPCLHHFRRAKCRMGQPDENPLRPHGTPRGQENNEDRGKPDA